MEEMTFESGLGKTKMDQLSAGRYQLRGNSRKPKRPKQTFEQEEEWRGFGDELQSHLAGTLGNK